MPEVPPELIRIQKLFASALEHQREGRIMEACHGYRRVLEIYPRHVAALLNLGMALTQTSRAKEAVPYYLWALTVKPDFAMSHAALAIAYFDMGLLGEARIAAARAVKLAENNTPRNDYERATSHNALAMILQQECRAKESAEHYTVAYQLNPQCLQFGSNLLLTMHYLDDITPTKLFEAHRAWADAYIQEQPHTWHQPHKPLRVGYASPDFRMHSVAFSAAPVVVGHDAKNFEVFCYADIAPGLEDQMTDYMKAGVRNWRSTFSLKTDDARRMIMDDGIDILVDLAGHTAKSRLDIFALRAAPIQVAWLGYPGTRGLKTMDYFLTDAYADPLEDQRFYTERLVHLPGCFVPFKAGDDAPGVEPPPVLKNKYITFGCFNSSPKFNSQTCLLWRRILDAVPGSKLVIKSKYGEDQALRSRLYAMLTDDGQTPRIANDRIEVRPWERLTLDHMQRYAEIDIALDTSPYNGTTTTLESSWMGVPVVSLAGSRHVSRQGLSINHALGFQEALCADSGEDYIRKAAKLAKDTEHLGVIRSLLRSRMMVSVCWTEEFVKGLERCYLGPAYPVLTTSLYP